MKILSNSKGFTLIEVMLALLILAIGILGISKLQGSLIKNSSDANQRAVATSLAQKKIDDLRSFAQLDSSGTTWAAATASCSGTNVVASNLGAASLAFADIGDNTGGAPTCEENLLANTDITIGNTTYQLSWDVTDYEYTAALSAASLATGTAVDLKNVQMIVTWADLDTGNNASVALSTIIDAYAPALTALSDNSKEGGVPPQVTYTPELAPEVVSLDVGDLNGNTGVKRETTSPDVVISQNQGYVQYDFSVVTYNSNGIAIKQEDFRHVNCTCEMQAKSPGVTTYYPTSMELIFDDKSYDNFFDATSSDFKVAAGGKSWGTRVNSGQAGQQSDSCDICCRDHHDDNGPNNPEKLFDPFRPSADYTNGNHNHYYPDNSGTLQLANDVGDTYLEACTLVKVDGIFRVTQDPLLLTVKTMPESYLLSTGFSDYQNYVYDYLLAYAQKLDAEASASYPASTIGPVGDSVTPSYKYSLNDANSATVVALANEPDLVSPALAVNDTVNLRSKTIYARYIPSTILEEIQDVVEVGTTWNDISNLIPFFDPDGTNIAQTGEDTSAWGVDEPTEIDVDQLGVLTALAATTAASGAIATATRTDSVTSFTNTRPIDPNDADTDYLTSDGMFVVVSGTAPSTSVDVQITVNASANSEVEPNKVTVTGSNGATCGLQANNVKNVYICSFASGGGRLTFSDYNTKQGSNIDNNNTVCLTGETISVTDDNTLTETSVINFTGLTDPAANKTVTIVLGTDGC